MVTGAIPGIDSLIGRAAELHQIDALLEATHAGRGHAVVVVGEPGIGKTRLCEEILARAGRVGFATGWGSCWPDGGAPPLWPWQDVLAGVCGADAVGLLDGDTGVAGVDTERFSRFTAIAGRLRERCRRRPTLLVIDDLHAADPGTVLLARFVARNLRGDPLLLVTSRRPGETAPETAAVLEAFEQDAHLIVLRHLDIHDTDAFLRAHGAAHVDPDFVLATLRLTGGNPLFLRRVVAAGDAGAGGSLTEVIRAAAGRLDADTRRVLSLAAVLGRSPAVAEVTALTGLDADRVLEAAGRAAAAGLVTVDHGRLAFTHDVIREVLESVLGPADLLAAHARAADLVTARPRRARHALRAAPRSADDTCRAVTACREAAAEMMTGFAHEQAATLLAECAAAHDAAGLGPLPALLLVEWAQAVLSCGRLGDARDLFDRAVTAADRDGDPVLLAAAALGLGGVWVSEQRTNAERERVRSVQRRALAGLADDEVQLRARLRLRIAAEEAYPGHDVTGVLEALAAARQVGTAATLAEGLSLTHHALLTPEHARARLQLADELVTVASAAGAGLLGLVGLCWRTVDLFILGDPAAERALAELRHRADALACRGVLYIANAMDVMLLIRAGQFEEAEAAAGACYALGVDAGDADALGYLGGQLMAIRWAQGREADLLDMVEEIAGSPTLAADDIAYPAAVAFLAARAGAPDRARLALDRLRGAGLSALPRSSTWLTGIVALIEAAALLGDADLAGEAYDLLAPYADQMIMPSLAVACFGSAERSLGVAARAGGRVDAAVEHLERGVAVNQRIGNRPAAAIAAAELAMALHERCAPGDRTRAASLIQVALDEGRRLAMSARVEAWEVTAARIADQPAAVLRREGTHWRVSGAGSQVLVADLVGMGYLAQLVGRPGVEMTAADLAGVEIHLTPQPIIDPAARAAYRQRARDLYDDLTEAEANADLARAERLRIELEALADELSATAAIGGRARAFAGPAERARTAVRKALVRAIDEIAAADPALGEHLRRAVTTGATCCYDPSTQIA
jgi:hypothetical protein